MSARSMFKTAQENSIEVYNEEFGRNTILTRSARMRKFKFYQYKPVQESPITTTLTTTTTTTTPTTNPTTANTFSEAESEIADRWNNSLSDTPKGPILLPRDDVVQGRVGLVAEQSEELGELDNEIAELERKIADLNDGCNNRNVDNLDEVFAMVNKKNDLLRRQMQLNIIEQERVLERANEELTKELRDLMSIDDSRKSRAQLERQQYLYEQSLALVNKRNELVHHMDFQERGIEDDNALKATLKNVTSEALSSRQTCVIQ